MEERLHQDLKTALLEKNEVALSTLRMLISEINYLRVSKGIKADDGQSLNDDDITSVIQKEVKKRREAAAGFRQGGREESAVKEEVEAKILEQYLPTQMSEEELTAIVTDAMLKVGEEVGTKPTIREMGKVISLVREKVGNSADGSRISSLVKEQLSND